MGLLTHFLISIVYLLLDNEYEHRIFLSFTYKILILSGFGIFRPNGKHDLTLFNTIDMSEIDVQDLLKKISLQNDQQAFKRLYFQYYKKLYNLALFYVKSSEAAEEVVNDTFMAIWARRTQLADISDFTSYIYKAAKNKSLNLLMQRKLPVHLDIEELNAEIEDVSLNIEDQIIVADFQHLIDTAVAKLPDQCRLVFKMIKEDGLPHKEVAELLNVSLRTIEYHMSIALKKLSESLNYRKNKTHVSNK